MRARRTVKGRDIVEILVFGYDRTLIKSIKDSGFRSMSDVISYANNKVRVYDFGDEVADRYTIVYVNKNIKDGYGVVYYPVFSCSEDPFHPLGVGMYAGDYYPHRSHMYNFGKRVKDIDSLPKKVIEFIKYITQ